jgi:hypothetical protein
MVENDFWYKNQSSWKISPVLKYKLKLVYLCHVHGKIKPVGQSLKKKPLLYCKNNNDSTNKPGVIKIG